MILPFLKIAGGTITHLCFAVGAIYETGKNVGFTGFRSAVPLPPNLLDLVKHFYLNDCRVRVIEHGPVFFRALPLLLIPDGIGVGIEIDGAAGVLITFKNSDTYVNVATL